MEIKQQYNYKRIGEIGNYYGGLYIMESEGKYYWMIEGVHTDFDDLDYWSEIDKDLYNSLVSHDNKNK